MSDDVAHVGEAGAVAPGRAFGLGIRQARAREPLFQVGKNAVRHLQREGLDRKRALPNVVRITRPPLSVVGGEARMRP